MSKKEDKLNFLTFSGESPTEALKQAQAQCGEDALVVSTKQIKKKMINSPGLYEVVVAVEDKNIATNFTYEAPKKNPYINVQSSTQSLKDSEDVLVNISKTAQQISKIAEVTTDKIGHNPSYAKQTYVPMEELKSIQKQMNKLNDKVKSIQDMFWEETAPKRNHLDIPPEFSEIYKLALQSGMGSEHLESIMRLTLQHMPTAMKHSSLTIKRYFQVLLRKMIPIRNEVNFSKGQQKVMMLVGPTGVGKTTTLAKLAGRFAFLTKKKYKVGIITLDTYRIGAVEQLFQYAKIMHLPIVDAVDVNDFEAALQSLRDCDIILIDTVGSSPNDREKLITLDTFLRQSSVHIDVSLVLSAGTKLEDLKDIYQNYSFLDIDTLIFTKFDETRMFGNVFSLVYSVDKPVSYISIGQDVPDDLRTATSEFLVDCMLNGFGKENVR